MNVLLRPAVRPVASSLTCKYVMALTGLGLIGFVIAHLAGNLLIYAGREPLNAYAHALEERPALLWTARIGLLAIFVIHVVLGIRLTRQNMQARPVAYVYPNTIQASWASRHMLLTGLVILAFVIYHLLHFTFGVADPDHFKGQIITGGRTATVADMVVYGFEQPAIAIAYVVAQVFLGLHLWHGARSWFQSLGLNHAGYNRLIHRFAVVVALGVAAGNISIPLSILFGYRPS